uniref:DNA replication helicase subunit n=1 Tax=Pyropia dentata TaxID=76160 RepID=UPI00286A5DB4|nr:DNA replication helicase subunit [Neoporphyra dentata]WKD83883.1 DNA replication helicase subunit [Neoporphyra dentata]
MLTKQSISLLKSVDKLSPDFFYFTSNSLLYRAVLENINHIKKISIGNFLVNLKTEKIITHLNELNEVISLIEQAPLSDVVDEYSSVIIDNYIKRLLLISGDSLFLISCSNQPVIQNNITSVVSELTKAYEILEEKDTQTLATILANLLVHLDTTKKISINSSVLSGFTELDSITQGFQKSDLIILAGRPSMGKTAFAINVARYIINKEKSFVILFSLEMSIEQLLRRILAQECHLNGQKIQSGQLNNDEWQYVIQKSKALADQNLYIDDSAKVSTDIIKTKVQFLKLQGNNIELIIIDYLQLLQDGRQSDNRSQELSLITRSLKILAKDLNLPILVLSQLNRNLETRSDKRPLLSDLRESGCISKFSHLHLPLYSQTQILFNFHHKHIEVTSFANQKLNLFRSSKANISKTGKKTIYRIITQSGKHLKLTSNHKILTTQGWKRCDEIDYNNVLAIQINTIKERKSVLNSFSSLFLTFENLKHVHVISLQAVFDLECQPLHNFIVNNFIVHNSIEQDADLVIMLYRESYYTQETLGGDLTEIIIAKHRNGPTGMFQLKFDAHIANFSNV